MSESSSQLLVDTQDIFQLFLSPSASSDSDGLFTTQNVFRTKFQEDRGSSWGRQLSAGDDPDGGADWCIQTDEPHPVSKQLLNNKQYGCCVERFVLAVVFIVVALLVWIALKLSFKYCLKWTGNIVKDNLENNLSNLNEA